MDDLEVTTAPALVVLWFIHKLPGPAMTDMARESLAFLTPTSSPCCHNSIPTLSRGGVVISSVRSLFTTRSDGLLIPVIQRHSQTIVQICISIGVTKVR